MNHMLNEMETNHMRPIHEMCDIVDAYIEQGEQMRQRMDQCTNDLLEAANQERDYFMSLYLRNRSASELHPIHMFGQTHVESVFLEPVIAVPVEVEAYAYVVQEAKAEVVEHWKQKQVGKKRSH